MQSQNNPKPEKIIESTRPTTTIKEWAKFGAVVPLIPAEIILLATAKNSYQRTERETTALMGLTLATGILCLPLVPAGALAGASYGVYENYIKAPYKEKKHSASIANHTLFSEKNTELTKVEQPPVVMRSKL